VISNKMSVGKILLFMVFIILLSGVKVGRE
jgi:hypothetical protein